MKGILLAVAAMLIWSTTAIQVKLLGMSAPALVVVSNLSAAAMLGAWLVVTRRVAVVWGFARDWRLISLCAVCAGLNGLTYFYAFAWTSTANALLTHYTAPIFVLLLGAGWLRERASRWAVLPLLLAGGGIALIATAVPAGGAPTDNLRGIGCGLLSALTYAVVMVAARRFPRDLDLLTLMFWQGVIAAAVALPFLDGSFAFTPRWWPLLIAFPLGNIVIAALLFFHALKTVKAFTVSILGYLEPVGALLLTIVLLGEPLTLRAGIGGALILFSGLLVVGLEERRAAVAVPVE